MATRTTGAELKAFYDDDSIWTTCPDVWHEELALSVNGKQQDSFDIHRDLKDDDQVTILAGYISSDDNSVVMPFESLFKRWRKVQDTKFLSVSVPKDKLEAVKAAIKAAGGKVL